MVVERLVAISPFIADFDASFAIVGIRTSVGVSAALNHATPLAVKRMVPQLGVVVDALIVVRDVAQRLAFYPTFVGAGPFGNGRGLPTTTHAKAAWVWTLFGYVLAPLVIGQIPKWFAFYHSSGSIVPFGNRSHLPATAMAVAVRDFVKGKLGLGGLWGMLRHAESCLSGFGLIRGRVDARCPVFLLGFTPVIVPLFTGK